MAQGVKNPTSVHEDVGLIPGLAQWALLTGIAVSCGLGHRCGTEAAQIPSCCGCGVGRQL